MKIGADGLPAEAMPLSLGKHLNNQLVMGYLQGIFQVDRVA